jgi:L-alanine-DL-glutamate epimerase-like enolase superfamily enzyme
MRLTVECTELRFARPLKTAYGELGSRQLVLLTLTGEDGVSGQGEAAPLEPYDGIPLAAVIEAIESYRRLLEDGERFERGELLEACRDTADLPQALAAVDLALWDRAGRLAGRPVCELLTASPAAAVEVCAPVVATDRDAAADEAAAAARAGFRCIKVKVGLGDDAARVAAVRAAVGQEVALRVDANGAWDVGEATRAIELLGPAGLELVEEPVHGVSETRALRERVAARIAVDETAALPEALGAADAVCLKVSRCGGISGLLAQAAVVHEAGGEPYLGSTYDGPLGIAAAVHAAAALAPLPPCGLATLALFADPGRALEVRDGKISVPRGPGLLGGV